jgi:uncharacterized protein YbjT (DUF2867 family)
VARILIVGCGCRGRELAAALIAQGHAVRGTTRAGANLPAIEAAGAEAVIADPDRLATVSAQLQGIGVLCWLMGTAEGAPEAVAALHGHRLESMLETLVDTHVRGMVYEAAGSVSPSLLSEGAEAVRRAGSTFRMPIEVVGRHPAEHEAWLAAMTTAAGRILAV